MKYIPYQKEIYAVTQKLVQTGLIRISSGNVSMRTADGNVAITPSSIPYDELDYSQIVILDMQGNAVEGKLKPSVEKMLHINTYKARSDAQAVIHTHSVYAITLSLIGAEIPPLSIEMINLGAPIQTTPYVLPGSLDFANTVAGYFGSHPEKKSALLENHGAISLGSSLKDTFQNAYNLETGANIYFNALAMGKKIRILSQQEIDELHGAYAPAKK
ncbi:MAG: class II aldolase/adducin family protein [Anaerolineae bacterium]|nr:class II aldolase/adducin family protein [Anaerolineae bacterium]